MAPPAFFTAGREPQGPPPPDDPEAYVRWMVSVFEESLFETQRGRFLRFVRVTRQECGQAALIVSKCKEPTADEEVLVPLAALRDGGVSPHIAKVFLEVFQTTIIGTRGEITAKKTKAEGESVAKIVVERTPALGTGTVRATQSTLTVQSFLSQVVHKLVPVHLEGLPADGAPATGGTPATPHEVVSWAALPKLVDLARAAEVFQSATPTLLWEDAEEFLTAALRRPVSGRPAVISAAARLNTKLTARTEARTAVAAALDVARETNVTLTMRDKGEIVATQGVPSTTTSPAARAPGEGAEQPRGEQPPPRPLILDGSESGSGRTSSSGSPSASDSSSDSYDGDSASGDEQPGAKRQRKRRRSGKGAKKSKKSARSKKSKRSHKHKKSKSKKRVAFSPDADLARLTPAGMKASQVAKVLFGHPALSQAVHYDNQVPESESEGEDVAQRRTAFAVRRLTEVCGKVWLPEAGVSSKEELRQIREHVVHLVARRSSGLHSTASGPPSHGAAAAGPSSRAQGRFDFTAGAGSRW